MAGTLGPTHCLLLWQLGEVRRQAAGLVLGQQLGRRSPTGFVLEIEIPERLPDVVADDEARVVVLLNRPGRREAARGGYAVMIACSKRGPLALAACRAVP